MEQGPIQHYVMRVSSSTCLMGSKVLAQENIHTSFHSLCNSTAIRSLHLLCHLTLAAALTGQLPFKSWLCGRLEGRPTEQRAIEELQRHLQPDQLRNVISGFAQFTDHIRWPDFQLMLFWNSLIYCSQHLLLHCGLKLCPQPWHWLVIVISVVWGRLRAAFIACCSDGWVDMHYLI